MNRLRYTLCCLLLASSVTAQQDNGNPLYWKNRKPHPGYWQQDVAYTIEATIEEQSHIIFGKQTLNYTNNSPDTLRFVYFHLYQNGYVKDSYTHKLSLANNTRPRFGSLEAQQLGIVLDHIKADGQAVQTELDNTILKVILPQALMPGATMQFTMDFETYYDRGSIRRRMQMYDAWGHTHYNGCQWYPKISVYDARFGWDTQQHLGKEFYGDFGSFDVTLDFAANYIVEATGVLQNREEMLPDTLRQKLDLKNFARKPWGEPPTEIIPYNKEERKKWHFKADLVHDFAFTADPSYRIGTEYIQGVECVALVQEPHASGWQNAAQLVAQTIATFSAQFGPYHYPKMIAADANDGMEYPMLTLDGGKEPGYRGLLVHEIAHNWFYGMVGNNETYRAFLDEGLTQFLTSEGLRTIDGDQFVEAPPKAAWQQFFLPPRNTRDVRAMQAYIQDAATGADAPLNTHSDDFNSAMGHGGGYRLVYYKTASMLYNLQLVLGDTLFAQAMKHYFNQWKFAHPYPEDFRNSIINYSKVDLNWFFDQWLETTKDLDYSIGKIRKIKGTDSLAITFRRKGAMHMPLDFTLTDKQGGQHSYYIPNTWFEKETEATTLPRWIGWGQLQPTYTARVHAPQGIRHIQIDTSGRFADRYMPDNYRSRPALISKHKLSGRWDGGNRTSADWKKYQLFYRPDLWYNAVDGIEAGMHLEGSYLNTYHNFSTTVWLHTRLGTWNRFQNAEGPEGLGKWINYTFAYSSPISRRLPQVLTFVNSRYLDGLWRHQLGWTWNSHTGNRLQLWMQSLHREPANDYLIYPKEWSSTDNRFNNSLNVAYTHAYQYIKGAGRFTLSMRAPVLQGDFDYSYVQLESLNERWVYRFLLRSRVFARYGWGQEVPYESALFQAGASPELMMDNKYLRSQGFLPYEWTGYSHRQTGHLHAGGGLNLRGYAGYYAFDRRGGEEYVAYKGRGGASLNLEIDFSQYLQWQPRMLKNRLKGNVYFFADGGVMELGDYPVVFLGIPDFWTTTPTRYWSDFRMDAGIGGMLTVKNWGFFDKAKPLTLRLDFPLFLNRPAHTDAGYWAPRWVVGINSAF